MDNVIGFEELGLIITEVELFNNREVLLDGDGVIFVEALLRLDARPIVELY